VKDKYERMKGPGLVREDLGPILRVIRDQFTQDVDRITIDSEEEFDRIRSFVDSLAPELKNRVHLYEGKRPLFDEMKIEPEITKALQRKVFLKSGGHICIDQTEALIAIDVNTGRFTGKKELEQTVLLTNLESADEIAKQVRLRDLGGIIVIDFIDMEEAGNRRKLLQRLTDALKADRAKTTVSEINELGMIEMTRKRVRHNIVRALSQPCPYCEGSGMVRSVTTVTFDMLRKLQKLFCETNEKRVILQVHPDVARRLRTENRGQLEDIAERFGREVALESVSDFHVHDCAVLRAESRKAIKF